MRIGLFILLITFAPCAAPQGKTRPPSADEVKQWMAQLKQLEAEGKTREMTEPMAKVVDAVRQIKGPESPEYARFLGAQAALKILLGEYPDAEHDFRQALSIVENPRKALKGSDQELPISTRASLGSLLMMEGKLEEARVELEKVVSEDVGWSDDFGRMTARMELGVVEWLSGRRPEGRQHLDEARSMADKIGPKADALSAAMKALAGFLEVMNEDGRKPDRRALDEAENELSAVPWLRPLIFKFRPMACAAAGMSDDLEASRQCFLRALQEQRDKFGRDHPDNAVLLSMLAGVERQLGHLDAAEQCIEEEEAILTKTFGAESLQTAEAMRERAKLRELRGDTANATKLIEAVRRIQAAKLRADHIDWADTLHLEAELAEDRGDLDEAEKLERRALQLWRTQYPDGHLVIAEALEHLVKVLVLQGKAKSGAAMMDEALTISRKVLPRGDRGLLFALVAAAIFRQETGDLRDSHDLLDEAAQSIPAGKFWSEGMGGLVSVHLAINCLLESNPVAADPLLTRAKSAVSSLPFGEGVQAEFNRLLGVLLVQRGAYVEADAPLRQALTYYQRRGIGHPDAIRTVLAIGMALRGRGDYNQARALFEQVYEELSRSGRQTYLTATLAASLAVVQMDRGDDGEAEKLLRSAIKITKQEKGPAFIQLAEEYFNLANIRFRAGDSKEAESLWSMAEEIASHESGPEHPIVAMVRSARARSRIGNGSDSKIATDTVRLADEAVRFTAAKLGADHPQVSFARGTLALAKWAAGDLEGARSEMQERARLEARNFSRWIVLGDETRYANLLDRFSSTDLYVSFHFNALPQSQAAAELALWAVLQRKGTLQDVVAEHARMERQSGSGAEAIARWKQKESAVTGCVSAESPVNLMEGAHAGSADCVKGILARAAEAGEAFRQALISVPSLAEAAKPVELPALAELLRKAGGFALVEIVQYRSDQPRVSSAQRRYAAYILLPDGPVRWADLGKQNEIDQAVRSLREMQSQLKYTPEAARHAARELDRLVMQPIRPLLNGITRLFVAADGDLNLIDFSSLADEQGNELIDRYLIAGLTSGRDLVRLGRLTAASGRRENHLFGNPSFLANVPAPRGADGSGPVPYGCGGAFDKRDWGEVAISLEEDPRKTRFDAAMPGLQHHLEQDASKAALLGIEHPRSVWLLTHGFFCENAINSGGDAPRAADAMQRAALVMAGAASDDPVVRRSGYVKASEIAALDWDGTELVVLGACETALGTPSVGDGVYGLRRAVTLAGARSQVMTMWEVPSAQTIELLANFADNMARGLSRLSALREAQKTARRKYEHPFFWAGFYFGGDPGGR